MKGKIFIQVNIGKEHQKSGVDLDELKLYLYCKNVNLDVIGLMYSSAQNNQKIF